MKDVSIRINSRDELNNYLYSVDYKKYKKTSMDSVYFLIKYEFDSKEIIEPIYFCEYEEGGFFENTVVMQEFDESLIEYINFIYGDPEVSFERRNEPLEDFDKEIVEYESQFQVDDKHYSIDSFSTLPFLPDSLEIIGIMNERDCLEYLIKEQEENDKQLDSFEKSLPKILQEKILDYKNKLYNDPKNVDKCYCELQSTINDMERQNLINYSQVSYLRSKYLGLNEKLTGDDKLLN